MKLVSIIGGASASSAHLDAARKLGEKLAEAGYGVVCGGLGGVMARACAEPPPGAVSQWESCPATIPGRRIPSSRSG